MEKINELEIGGERIDTLWEKNFRARCEPLQMGIENAFEKCFDDWIIPWHKCIISGGAYFEGDKINLDE